MRRVVFFGNHQARSFARYYKQHIAPRIEDEVEFVAGADTLSDAARKIIGSANIIAVQLTKASQPALPASLGASGTVELFPYLCATFLWPFGGVSHPTNKGEPNLPQGPYPRDFGDRFLNSQISQGIAPETAYEAYVAHDVVREGGIDNLYRSFSGALTEISERCSAIPYSDFVCRHLHEQPLFTSRDDLGGPLAALIAEDLFLRLGVPQNIVSGAVTGWTKSPLSNIHVPIHPAIAKFFKLAWADDRTAYELPSGERVQFADYARRYVGYYWNASLAAGIAGARNAKAPPEERARTVQHLTLGLTISPESSTGRSALAVCLALEGQLDDALIAARDAIARDPGDASLHLKLADLLVKTRAFEAAEASYRTALQLNPHLAHAAAQYAHLLAAQGRMDEAVASAERAFAIEPATFRFQGLIALFLFKKGDLIQAETVFHEALERSTGDNHAILHAQLGDVLWAQGRHQDAVLEKQKAIAVQPWNPRYPTQVADLLVKSGELDRAIKFYEQTLMLDRDSPHALAGLASIMGRMGRTEEAVVFAERAVASEPATKAFQLLRNNLLKARSDKTPSADPERVPVPQPPTPTMTTIMTRPGARARKRIVFLGNCHAPVYGGQYARWIAPLNDDTITVAISYDPLSKQHEEAIRQADIIVNQVFDAPQKNDVNNVVHRAEVINFPNISASFLWPYSSEPHIKNKPEPNLPAGPYVRDLGDRFLNRFMHKGTDAEEALRAYMVHDPAKVADRFYELANNSQVIRDGRAGGWTCARFIQENFRKEWMFLTHNHPNLRLAAHLASGIYRRLGVAEADIDRVIGSWGKQTPFARVQAPIHPGIARHFKLDYIAEGQTFESFVGERETFEAYCRRYLAYDWNRDLASGIELAKRPDNPGHDIDHSIGLLQSGLAQSPGSAIGELALAHLLLRVGRVDEATAASERACALDKDSYRNLAFHGQMLLRARRFAEAFDLLDKASRDFPGIAQIWDSCSVALASLGRIEGAAAAIRRAMEIEPFNTRLTERLRGLEERLLVPAS